MRNRLAILGLVAALTGACRDRTAPGTKPAPAASTAGRAAPQPVLQTAELIENLDGAQAEARERLVATVQAIEYDQPEVFHAMVSSAGFAAGTLALDPDQLARELAGRTVAEVTNIACAGTCRWRVALLDAKHVELEARSNGGAAGAIELMREDDGSWALSRTVSVP